MANNTDDPADIITSSSSSSVAHNSSPQTHVARNNDPALDISHEHHHAHLHHSAFAEKGREDEVVYTAGTTFERSMIPEPEPREKAMHQHHAKDTWAVSDKEKALRQVESGSEEEGEVGSRTAAAGVDNRYGV